MFEENDDYDEAADLALEAKLKQEAKDRLESLKRAREAEEAAQRVGTIGLEALLNTNVALPLIPDFCGSCPCHRGCSGG